MKTHLLFLTLSIATVPIFAQLTTDQKVGDFQNMAALYAKRYAPYEWKKQSFGFDLLQIGPWLDRVRASKDDIEFYEIAAEYVSNLHDTHSSFISPYRMVADLGIVVDIYDGKLLIEGINRTLLPVAQFPFQTGDEVVTVDGKTMEEWITVFSRSRQWGSPRTTRRYLADAITFRPTSVYPRALDLGASASVVVRRNAGNMETYTVPWTKTGYTGKVIGRVPSPQLKQSVGGETPDYMALLNQMRNWKMADNDPLLSGETVDEETGETVNRRYLLGIGSRAPVFALPAGFTQRLGTVAGEFHFSGTFTSGGSRIGYLRVPAFSTNATSLREIAQEIAFFQANTDGLIVDVMRNGGGDCYMLRLASYLIPTPGFYFFGEELRPTYSLLTSFQNSLDAAKRARADQWVIDLYSAYLNVIETAYKENRGRTGRVPACSLTLENNPAVDSTGVSLAYTKPLVILVDEFSISAADIFPAMMQDNKRGVIVGMRTSGGGGSVSGWPLFYSEASFTNTNTLVVRNAPASAPDLPSAPYVENIGTIPDIELDYMTRDNLINRGRTFVDQVTQIMLTQIKNGQK